MAVAKKNTNWFAVGVSAAVVVVLIALGGVVWFMNNQATSPGATPTSNQTFDAKTGAISFGEGKDEIAVFADFQCPICKSFEDQFGADLEAAAADGRITLSYHPIAILDRYSQGTEYSSLGRSRGLRRGVEPRQVPRLRQGAVREPARGEQHRPHERAARRHREAGRRG